LVDDEVKERIINSAELSSEDIVVEIGGGGGVLTEELAKRSKKVVTIEKDRELVKILKEKLRDFSNLEILEKDILKVRFKDIKDIERAEELKVIGNLPYYISTPIIFHLFEQRERIKFILICVQKELGERLVAQPGSKNYGILSIKARFFSHPRIVFDIPRRCFFPVPQVDSCLLRLDILKEKRYAIEEDVLFRTVEVCFAQRRKTILNNLVQGFSMDKGLLKRVLKEAGIDYRERPEAVSIEKFILLANRLRSTG